MSTAMRLFVPSPLRGQTRVRLTGDRAHYLLRVLRLGPGASLTVFDGYGGECPARIAQAGRREVELELAEHRDAERESPLPVRLIQGVSRGDRMDFAVQKATELGVAAVLPALCAFGVVKLDAAQRRKRREHWQGVAVSACEQCGRNRVPEIAEPQPLAEILRALEGPAQADTLRLALAPMAPDSLGACAPPARALLLVGPEGGLEDAELAAAARAGFRLLRLGPRVLRTETAAAAALAALQTLWGDLG